jgi:DNA-binding CsgD family transcriptional regulator
MAPDGLPQLTPRERDVLAALCRPVLSGAVYTEPASTRAIAEELFVSEAAVKQHLLRLYDKLGIYSDEPKRRVSLANEALRLGLIHADESRVAIIDATTLANLGREAMASRSWDEAYEALAAADVAGSLKPRDLEALGEAALWTDHHDESIAARQRAHEAYLGANDRLAAARVAIALVPNHIARLNLSAASGWFNKAKSLLEDQPESATHGELAAMTSLIQLANGEIEAGLANALIAHRLGKEYGDRDLVALGLVFQGYARTRLGLFDDSMAMLDEAMASAVAGELGPFATAIVYCRTICTCLDLFDFRRAAEWTDLVQGITDRTGPVGVAGDCRTHQVTVKIFRGEWDDGEREAERACDQSAAWDLNHTAIAQYELGRIKHLTGDFTAAAESFRRSHELGGLPQPGLALLRMSEGDLDGASAAIAGALASAQDQLTRAKLLPAQVDIALRRGDVDTARSATIELDGIAERYGSEALHAAAKSARGALHLTDGDARAAIRDLRSGRQAWQNAGAPYETARTSLHLAKAFEGIGDHLSATMELETALATFQRLGAAPDAEIAASMLQDLDHDQPPL